MGEIKSTLDLVMERTRHLSMSSEEKERQQNEDFRKRLNGLLANFDDGALTVEALRDRISQLQEELKVDDRRIVLSATGERIDPEKDNRRWLQFLAVIDPAIAHSLEKRLSLHVHRQTERMDVAKETSRDRLTRDHGVRGSAVVPNPNKDPAYRRERAALNRQTMDEIEAIIDEA